MILSATVGGQRRSLDISRPIPISIPVRRTQAVNAFGLPDPAFEPFRMGSFIGSVEDGGAVNCEVVHLAPHGNGTHTECIGHIAGRQYQLSECLLPAIMTATLVSVTPINDGRGLSVSRGELEQKLDACSSSAVIVRTLPNSVDKRSRRWSGTQPPYMSTAAMQLLVDLNVHHLLIDVPSVDPEFDNGALEAHHIFWQWPNSPRFQCTITEMVYIPNDVPDGEYALTIGVAPLETDASPSTVILFAWDGEAD